MRWQMDNLLSSYEVISEAKAYKIAKEYVLDLMCSENFTPENAKEMFAKEHEKSLAMQRILQTRHSGLLD